MVGWSFSPAGVGHGLLYLHICMDCEAVGESGLERDAK